MYNAHVRGIDDLRLQIHDAIDLSHLLLVDFYASLSLTLTQGQCFNVDVFRSICQVHYVKVNVDVSRSMFQDKGIKVSVSRSMC